MIEVVLAFTGFVCLWFWLMSILKSKSLDALSAVGLRHGPFRDAAVYDCIEGDMGIGNVGHEHSVRVRIYKSGIGLSFKNEKDEVFVPLDGLCVGGSFGQCRYINEKGFVDLRFSHEVVKVILAMKQGQE